MAEVSTEIKPSDIKKPKKLLKKAKAILFTALGGIGQRIADSMIQSFNTEGKINPFWISVLETLGFSIAGGTIKNKSADQFFAGATAGAAADALERGLFKVGIDIHNLAGSKFKIGVFGKPTTTPTTSQTGTSPPPTTQDVDEAI